MSLPIENFKRCGIPKMYFGEKNSLKQSRDKLGDTLYDLTDPEKPKLLTSALHNHFWLMSGKDINDARQLMFLLARAFALSNSDLFCASTDTILSIVGKQELDGDEIEYMDKVYNTDILFLDDFHDQTARTTWGWDRQPLRVILRRRIENEKHVITYSSHPLADCSSWPASFLEFLSYHIYALPLKGKR